MSEINCVLCQALHKRPVQRATLLVRYGSPEHPPRELELCRACVGEVWERCAPLVNSARMVWSNTPIEQEAPA